jgi:hypothetical protein
MKLDHIGSYLRKGNRRKNKDKTGEEDLKIIARI